MKCPECGSTNINQYRMITGPIWCEECKYRVEEKEKYNPFVYVNNTLTQKSYFIEINEEDIMNLKNAWNRIYNTLDYGDGQYEALELFTLKSLINKWEEKDNNGNQKDKKY